MGMAQSTLANKLRLLSLDEAVQHALQKNEISERHARSLLKLSDKMKQVDLLNDIIRDRLTVKQVDEEIDKILNGYKRDDTVTGNINVDRRCARQRDCLGDRVPDVYLRERILHCGLHRLIVNREGYCVCGAACAGSQGDKDSHPYPAVRRCEGP